MHHNHKRDKRYFEERLREKRALARLKNIRAIRKKRLASQEKRCKYDWIYAIIFITAGIWILFIDRLVKFIWAFFKGLF